MDSIGEVCVQRALLISTALCVLLSVAAILMIVIKGVAPTHSSLVKEIAPEAEEITSRQRHPFLRHNPAGLRIPSNATTRKVETIRELDPVVLKLRNVIDKYDLKSEDLKKLYAGVDHCGVENCGKSPDLLYENRSSESFRCRQFKNTNDLKNLTSELLKNFHKGVQNLEDWFKRLIFLEEKPRFEMLDFSNGSRLQVLRELKTDLRMLDLEIEELIGTKKEHESNSKREMRRMKSQMDLMIEEWRVIQQSREFLEKWQKQTKRVFRCWKKRKGKKLFATRRGAKN